MFVYFNTIFVIFNSILNSEYKKCSLWYRQLWSMLWCPCIREQVKRYRPIIFYSLRASEASAYKHKMDTLPGGAISFNQRWKTNSIFSYIHSLHASDRVDLTPEWHNNTDLGCHFIIFTIDKYYGRAHWRHTVSALLIFRHILCFHAVLIII